MPSPLKSQSLRKFTSASATPTVIAILNSFQSTRPMSFRAISPRARPRMVSVEAWEPQLPPVPMSMGMHEVSATPSVPQSTSALSKWEMIRPVNVAEIIRKNSQGSLFFARLSTPVRRYSSSEWRMAAIFSKSSVFSSSMTSITSSTVMMPTSLPSLSTTGMDMRS